MLNTRPHLAALPLAIAALALAACSGGDNPSKAGGSGPTVTLRIGSANYPNSAATDAMKTLPARSDAVGRTPYQARLEAPAWLARGIIGWPGGSSPEISTGQIPAAPGHRGCEACALLPPLLVTSD